MLRKLSFVAGLIVYSMSAKIIMRYSIARDTIFLLQYLRLSGLRDLQGISFLVEVLVILISCSYVGLVLFKAHCHQQNRHFGDIFSEWKSFD